MGQRAGSWMAWSKSWGWGREGSSTLSQGHRFTCSPYAPAPDVVPTLYSFTKPALAWAARLAQACSKLVTEMG